MRGDIGLAPSPAAADSEKADLPTTFHDAAHARPTGRILLISHAAELGGAEQGLLDVARHFGAKRCDALLFTDGPLRHLLEARGISVAVLGPIRESWGCAGRAVSCAFYERCRRPSGLRRKWRKIAKPYGLLYANSQKAALTAMLAGALGRKPVLWHLHDILSAEHFGLLQRRVITTLSNYLASAVIVVSSAARAPL